MNSFVYRIKKKGPLLMDHSYQTTPCLKTNTKNPQICTFHFMKQIGNTFYNNHGGSMLLKFTVSWCEYTR